MQRDSWLFNSWIRSLCSIWVSCWRYPVSPPQQLSPLHAAAHKSNCCVFLGILVWTTFWVPKHVFTVCSFKTLPFLLPGGVAECVRGDHKLLFYLKARGERSILGSYWPPQVFQSHPPCEIEKVYLLFYLWRRWRGHDLHLNSSELSPHFCTSCFTSSIWFVS